jgi:predicted DNA-binding antitoxin AbrB/MazE fold protein
VDSYASTGSNRRKAMAGTIRARVRSGMLDPLEKLDFPEGKELTLTILDLPSGLEKDAFLCSAGAWKGLLDADELVRISMPTV